MGVKIRVNWTNENMPFYRFIEWCAMNMKPFRGKTLDVAGMEYGVKRKRYFFGLIKESDKRYRRRITETIRAIANPK